MTTKNKKLKFIEESKLFFGLDHMELYLSEFEYLIDDSGKEIDLHHDYPEDEKSAFYIDLYGRKFKIEKIYPKGYSHGYQFLTSISDTPVVLFTVNYPQQEIHRKSLVIHSTFFITQKYLDIKIVDFIETNFLVSDIRRLDIALDLPIPIVQLLDEYFKNVHFHSQIGKDPKSEGFHQTYYIGQLQSDINSKYLIRIYDKILDTFKKNKGFLYSHLKDRDDVRRIELELRRYECSRLYYSYQDILNNRSNAIQTIFGNYLNKHWNIEMPSNLSLIPYHYDEYDLKGVYNETGFIPHRYLSTVRGYIKKIIKNTGYRGLSQVLSTCQYDIQGNIRNKNQTEMLKFLDAYISYLIETGTQKSLIKKIYKKNLK